MTTHKHWTDALQISDPRSFKLAKFSAKEKLGWKKGDKAEARLAENLDALASLQHRVYAEGKQSLLIVLQGIDASGKDGTIRRVFSIMNPQGCPVYSFKVPSSEERRHDFLWRIHKAMPGKGEIGIFNRSHYEDVLVVRVKNLAPASVWKARYDIINRFETDIASQGTRILKFFLYIDKDEQKARFEERLKDPTKNWKFSSADLEERKHWDAYLAAFQDMLTKCSTKQNPWYVIPSNSNWFRNLAVSEITRRVLEEMDPQFPPPEEGLDRIVVE